MSNRLQKINETLHHEISKIIVELEEEDWGIPTITDVQINPDLKSARIWISGSDEIIEKLNNKTPEITKMLRPRITFKHIPKLQFIKEDNTISRVEELLEKIR